MLSEDEVHARLRSASAPVAALDSNVVFGNGLLRILVEVSRWNKDGVDGPKLRLVIPALVHAEHTAFERRKHGPDFDITKLRAPLQTHNFLFDPPTSDNDTDHWVAPFDVTAAESCAEALARRWGTEKEWDRERKLRRWDSSPVDLYIWAQAAANDWLLVTNDTGHEFADARAAITNDAIFRKALARGRAAENSP